MESGRPPSSKLDPDQLNRLDAAQGDLRDAVGGVHNLAQLLANVRVGPRAVEAVLPDVHTAATKIEATVRTLLELIAPNLPDRTAPEDLARWVAPRAEELARELGAARGKPVHAKQRLHLEQVLRRVSRELEAARALLELLDAAVRGSGVRVELAELLREATGSRAEETSGTVMVRLGAELAGEVLLNPRVAIALVGIGARLVAEGAQATPTVTVKAAGQEAFCLEIAAAPADGPSVTLPAPALIGPSVACALAAARASGTELVHRSDTHTVTLTWPA